MKKKTSPEKAERNNLMVADFGNGRQYRFTWKKERVTVDSVGGIIVHVTDVAAIDLASPTDGTETVDLKWDNEANGWLALVCGQYRKLCEAPLFRIDDTYKQGGQQK